MRKKKIEIKPVRYIPKGQIYFDVKTYKFNTIKKDTRLTLKGGERKYI